MKASATFFDPFVVMALLVIFVCSYIFVSVYFGHTYSTFTTEEQVRETSQAEFGILANYL